MLTDTYIINKLRRVVRGGEGSGHFEHVGRPGKVGGSAPSGQSAKDVEGERSRFLTRTVKSGLRDLVDFARNNDTEKSIVYSEDGSQILAEIDGNNVQVDMSDVWREGLLDNAIVAHNHPKTRPSSFSPRDVLFMLEFGPKAIYATDSDFVYEMVWKPSRDKNLSDLDNIEAAIAEIQPPIIKEMLRIAKSANRPSNKVLAQDTSNQLWEEIEVRFPDLLDYTRIAIDDL